MRPLATLLLFLIFSGAIAADPGLKPPPTPDVPAPAQPAPPDPQFYLISAQAIEQVNQLVDLMRREIERLRVIVDKGSCS